MTIAAIVTRGIGPSSGPSRIVRRGYHSYIGLIDQAEAGRRLLVAGPPSYDDLSIFDDVNSAQGNVADIPLVWTPSGETLGMEADGLPYVSVPTTGRQQFDYREFDISDLAYIVVTDAVDGITATYYVENEAPVQILTIEPKAWFAGLAIDPVILGDYVQDPDDAENLLEYTGTLPAGLTFELHTYNPGEVNERIVWQIEGTPTTPGTGAISIDVTDVPGATLSLADFAYTITAQITVPTVDEGATMMADGLIEFAAAGLSVVAITPQLNAAPPGIIFDQDPEGGTQVPPNTPCILYVSGVTRPIVTGMTRVAAIAAIEAVGLVANIIEEFSDEVDFDFVIEQNPPGTGVMLPGDIVLVTVSLSVQVFTADVRAYKPGFFGGLYRYVGDTFTLSVPEEYSPYWMEFIGSPPGNWVAFLEPFSQFVDGEILEFGDPGVLR